MGRLRLDVRPHSICQTTSSGSDLFAPCLIHAASALIEGARGRSWTFFLTFFQYYLLTKDPVPMEIDFLVQDTFSLVRPQWKVATDLAEAAKLFQEAIEHNYKQQAVEKAADAYG